MDEKIYTVTLADGTAISNLRLNGNNYISTEPIDAAIFDGNCSPVIINDGIKNETHDNMQLVQVTESASEYWFILRDLSSEELARIKMQSDIEYLAMMSNIEL